MLFRKKEKKEYLAFVNGTLLDLKDVSDPVFSQKMMGDGFAIEPKDNDIYAPCDGEIAMVFPTKHAMGIKQKSGTEILLHLGIDTVALQGEGFEVFVKEGDHVSAGQLIAKMDIDSIKKQEKPVTSMLIFTSGEKVELLKANQNVTHGDAGLININ